MKIITIIGARPQIIKAAAISRAIQTKYKSQLNEIIVHTGQHYDENMSEVFFEELGIPKPNYNLNVGSGNHGSQTAKMLEGIEEIILKENPNAVLVYGDTNSTVAGGLAASKLLIPLIHIEAGLRSFNKTMPEEINRITCDHMSTLLFSPTKQGCDNLKREGFNLNAVPPFNLNNPKVYHCGDIMYDNSLFFSTVSDKNGLLAKLSISENEKFVLATIHRNQNTDEPERLNSIFGALNKLVQKHKISLILPLHPRTKKMMEMHLSAELKNEIFSSPLWKIIPPVSFLEVIALEKNAELVITDSGGVQKEAYFFNKPSLILRPQTEWVEIVEGGCALLCDADEKKIEEGFEYFISKPTLKFNQIFGDGKAAEFICSEVLSQLS